MWGINNILTHLFCVNWPLENDSLIYHTLVIFAENILWVIILFIFIDLFIKCYYVIVTVTFLSFTPYLIPRGSDTNNKFGAYQIPNLLNFKAAGNVIVITF